MSTDQVRILHVGVKVPFARAYEFARRPENFSNWAAGLATSLHRTDNGWTADTPEGEATVVFSEPNPYGVLDHRVRIDGKPEIYIPLRMVGHGEITHVELMLFRQPGMTVDQFERDADLVMRDLRSLKSLLEAGPA